MSRYNRYQRSHSRDHYNDDYHHTHSSRTRDDHNYSNYKERERNWGREREREREDERDYYNRSREKERDKEKKQEMERIKEIEYERMIERERMKERELRLEKEKQNNNKPISKWSEATSKFTSKPTINPLNPIENKSPFMPFPNTPMAFIPNIQPQLNNNDNQQPQSPSHNSIFQSQPQNQINNTTYSKHN